MHVQPVEQKLKQIKAVEEHIAPKFLVNLPAKLKVQEGEPIRLSCQVDGIPKPVVNWLKDGKTLPTSLRFATDFSSPTGHANLTVTSTLLTDCGNYTAVAENPGGKAYSSSQVFIKEASGLDTTPFTKFETARLNEKNDAPYDSVGDDDVPLNRAKPPKVIHPLQNLKHVEGEPINMGCKIDGYPRPKLTWLKDGQPLLASNRFSTHYDINTGVARLKISDANLNDAGLYSVLAENKAGSDHTDGQLLVLKDSSIDETPMVNQNAFNYLNRPEAPRREDVEQLTPPKFIVPLSSAKVQEGKPILLACKIEGTPKPMVNFTKMKILKYLFYFFL